MGKVDVAALRALADAATPAPWQAVLENDPRGQPVAYYRALIGLMANRDGGGYLSVVAGDEHRASEDVAENAAFIAAAREAVPALCDRVEELERALDNLVGRHSSGDYLPLSDGRCALELARNVLFGRTP